MLALGLAGLTSGNSAQAGGAGQGQGELSLQTASTADALQSVGKYIQIGRAHV